MILKAIVVVDKNWAIGFKGQLLIHIPEDLQHFKEKTWGSIVLYGKNTLASFPNGKPLPGRKNWILSAELAKKISSTAFEENTCIFASQEALFKALADLNSDEVVWLIGGAQLYSALLSYCSEVVVTALDYEAPQVDAFFPDLSQMENWVLREEGERQKSQKARISFQINVYTRKDMVMKKDED